VRVHARLHAAEASERVPTSCLLASPCLFNRGQGIFHVTGEEGRARMHVVCARPGSDQGLKRGGRRRGLIGYVLQVRSWSEVSRGLN
jgi:hypothetical protein